jgi:hypothetical protein
VVSALLIASALAQEADIEIEVWGEGAVRNARSAVVRDLVRLGWRDRPRRDGEIAFRPPLAWVGRARLGDDGSLEFGRKVLAFERADLIQPTDPREDFAALWDRPSSPTAGPRLWILPSERKSEHVRDAAREATASSLAAYRDVLRRTALHDRADAVPAQLDACWRDGRPIDGGAPLMGEDARRDAILAFWASRLDTEEGRLVRRAMEAWMEATWPPLSTDQRERVEAKAGRELPVW